jgi:leader peptidase (prepilin peptidase) / N-methyltransferase
MEILENLFEINKKLFLDPGINFIIRMIIFVLISICCVISDIKKGELPSIILIILSVVLLIFELFVDRNVFFNILTGAVMSSVLFGIIIFFSKGGIGLGDMFYQIFFASLFGCFFAAAGFLFSFWIATLVLIIPFLLKKIDAKKRIPFIPFMFAGFVSVILAGLVIK